MSFETEPERPPPLPPEPEPESGSETDPEPPPWDAEAMTGPVKSWIVAAHLLPLLAYPLFWIPGSAAILAAPLVVRRYRGRSHPAVDDQAREAFEFHVVAAALTFLFGLTIVGWFVAWLVVAAATVLAILACVRACEGERYRYPWIPRFLE